LRIVPRPTGALDFVVSCLIRDTVTPEGNVDFFRVIEARRSVRVFEQRPIETEKLQGVLEAVERAPSAGNLQSYALYVVRGSRERRSLVRAAGDQDFVGQAPVVLVFCAHPARAAARYGTRGAELYCVQDATIACTIAMLAATALDLSSVWVGAFDEEVAAEVIGAAKGHRPVAILPIGYGAETPMRRERRPLADLVREVGDGKPGDGD
jgi:nitroreductase